MSVLTIFIFILTYFIFFHLWMSVKNPYGKAVALFASRITAFLKDVELKELVPKDETVKVSFTPHRHILKKSLVLTIVVSSYTFNAPLTFAVMACFLPELIKKYYKSQKKKLFTTILKLYLAAVLILIVIHILYVFLFEAFHVSNLMVSQGFEDPARPAFVIWQALWLICDNLIIRYEPFIIGIYLYISTRSPAVSFIDA
ncbi:membrane protein [Candidatus Magnetoovum chiemensis]|nr:membrane protein [Candidatus Magnetoovum chiemensis]